MNAEKLAKALVRMQGIEVEIQALNREGTTAEDIQPTFRGLITEVMEHDGTAYVRGGWGATAIDISTIYKVTLYGAPWVQSGDTPVTAPVQREGNQAIPPGLTQDDIGDEAFYTKDPHDPGAQTWVDRG